MANEKIQPLAPPPPRLEDRVAQLEQVIIDLSNRVARLDEIETDHRNAVITAGERGGHRRGKPPTTVRDKRPNITSAARQSKEAAK